MTKFPQATTDQLYFRDPAIEPPPKATSMLLLNPGGVCIIGVWDDSCIGWCPKPKIPKTLKRKMTTAEYQEMMIERQEMLEQAFDNAYKGFATEEDWAILRSECGLPALQRKEKSCL